MKFIEIAELPEQTKKTHRGKPTNAVREFLDKDIKYARVDLSEDNYSSLFSAAASLRNVITQARLNNVMYVTVINNELYVARSDM